jgi:hypothetical protein
LEWKQGLQEVYRSNLIESLKKSVPVLEEAGVVLMIVLVDHKGYFYIAPKRLFK